MIKFRKYYVTNGDIKARVLYSIGNATNRIDGRNCVILLAKDYDRSLDKVFKNQPIMYVNETDPREDYFETGRVVLFEDNQFYAEAKKIADAIEKKRAA